MNRQAPRRNSASPFGYFAIWRPPACWSASDRPELPQKAKMRRQRRATEKSDGVARLNQEVLAATQEPDFQAPNRLVGVGLLPFLKVDVRSIGIELFLFRIALPRLVRLFMRRP